MVENPSQSLFPSQYIVFEKNVVTGWKLYDGFDTMRECLEAIEKSPNQERNYSIYAINQQNKILFPTASQFSQNKTKYHAYNYCKGVAGKEAIRHDYLSLNWCIKAEGMPYLFSDNIWDY